MLVHVWGVAYAAGTLCVVCVCSSLPDVSWQKQLLSSCLKQLEKLETAEIELLSALVGWELSTGHRLKGGEPKCVHR